MMNAFEIKTAQALKIKQAAEAARSAIETAASFDVEAWVVADEEVTRARKAWHKAVALQVAAHKAGLR